MNEMIKRISTSEAVVNYYVERIKDGTLKAGEKLQSERDLKEFFGISRFALREGIAKLEALGLIEVRHGKTSRISTAVSNTAISSVMLPLLNSNEAIEHLIETRQILESEMAALAAQHHTDEDIKVLETILATKVLDDPIEVANIDYNFHLETARISGNIYLKLVYESLRPHIISFLLKYLKSENDSQLIIDRHLPLLNAIKKGDPELARKEANSHINVCANSIKEQS